MTTAYLAAEGFADQLQEELRRAGAAVMHRHERLFVCDGAAVATAWAANVWHDCQELPVDSIGSAAKTLRDIQRNWAMYAPLHHRRAALIQERLPHVSAKPSSSRRRRPAPLGSWTLLSPDRLLAAAQCSSPFANGEVAFVEDRTGPPNRAYLKLWEALVRLGRWPGPGERCLDLGASPGGWTWVLAELGAAVVAVDKAPLDPRVAAMPGVDAAGKRIRARTRRDRGGGLAVLRRRLLSGAAARAGRALARAGWCAISSAPSNSRARPTTTARASPRSPARRSCICITTSTS